MKHPVDVARGFLTGFNPADYPTAPQEASESVLYHDSTGTVSGADSRGVYINGQAVDREAEQPGDRDYALNTHTTRSHVTDLASQSGSVQDEITKARIPLDRSSRSASRLSGVVMETTTAVASDGKLGRRSGVRYKFFDGEGRPVDSSAWSETRRRFAASRIVTAAIAETRRVAAREGVTS